MAADPIQPMKRLVFLLLVLTGSLRAADALSAAELAARACEPDGSSYIRMRMDLQQPPGTKKGVLQIQIKQRRAGNDLDAVYQILWPKERKGEAVLIQSSDGKTMATARSADGKTTTLNASAPLFDSDLAIADPAENFFAWKTQKLDGTEVIGSVTCQILESRPGPGDTSIYSRVRSWIDPKRFVPLRVEKYSSSGALVRRIETTSVAPDGRRFLPANLSIRRAQNTSKTDLDGSRLQRGVTFADKDFTVEGMADLAAPGGAATR